MDVEIHIEKLYNAKTIDQKNIRIAKEKLKIMINVWEFINI